MQTYVCTVDGKSAAAVSHIQRCLPASHVSFVSITGKVFRIEQDVHLDNCTRKNNGISSGYVLLVIKPVYLNVAILHYCLKICTISFNTQNQVL